MPFRLWFYLCKIGAPILFVTVFLTFTASDTSALGQMRFFAICLLVILTAVGAVMGIMLHFDRLHMRCPFCGKPGVVGGDNTNGLWMVCDSCGLIHGRGLFKLKLIKTEIED